MGKEKKIICHIDVNSAFLSWSALYRLRELGEKTDLRDIPSAVCGDRDARHGVILAKSGPAKKFGIKTGEPYNQALRKCPQLITVPPDYKLYVENSHKFISILKEMAPIVEQYSIDEAWIDITGTKHLYGDPINAAELIKNRIRDELGFTVNVGVSCNKILAKMASDFQKPDRVHTLFPHELEQKMWPLPVSELFMVGAASCRKLQSMGITTIGQLAHADVKMLRLQLHKHGEMIWDFANGKGEDQLNAEAALNKGYGNSLTTSADIRDRDIAHKILLSLCETVSMRMRRDKQSAACISVNIRTTDFDNISRQQQLEEATDITMEIYRAACMVFDKLWDGHTPLRLLGVYLSKLEQGEQKQLSLFVNKNHEKHSKTDKTIDVIRGKFGENAIMRARFLQQDIAPMSGGLSKEKRSGITKPTDEQKKK